MKGGEHFPNQLRKWESKAGLELFLVETNFITLVVYQAILLGPRRA